MSDHKKRSYILLWDIGLEYPLNTYVLKLGFQLVVMDFVRISLSQKASSALNGGCCEILAPYLSFYGPGS